MRAEGLVIGWFDTTEVTTFAISIADEYARLRKSIVVRGDSAEKRTQRFEKLSRKVLDYTSVKRLNFYKKAKMVNEIKHRLRSANIPEPEIAMFANSLLVAPLA